MLLAGYMYMHVSTNVKYACKSFLFNMTFRESSIVLKELCHDILSHFCDEQSHLQIAESLKVIVY